MGPGTYGDPNNLIKGFEIGDFYIENMKSDDCLVLLEAALTYAGSHGVFSMIENFAFSLEPEVIFCTILPISITGTILSK